MREEKVAELQVMSAQIRRSALEMVYRATSGHIGGSFSICELLTVLYFEQMRIDPKAPRDPDRGIAWCSVRDIARRRFMPRLRSEDILRKNYWKPSGI